MRMICRCPAFDLNDQALIEGAGATGRPAHVAEAIEAAVRGFRMRMQTRGPAAIVDGEFCDLCDQAAELLRRLLHADRVPGMSDDTGLGLARVMSDGPSNMKQPASPDVEFVVEPICSTAHTGIA